METIEKTIEVDAPISKLAASVAEAEANFKVSQSNFLCLQDRLHSRLLPSFYSLVAADVRRL